MLDLTLLRVDHQHPSTSASHVRVEDRPGCAHLYFEALPHHGFGVGVQQDGDLVAWRVLELLDHQLATPCRRRPVHATQGLPLLVVAHAMELEAAVPP